MRNLFVTSRGKNGVTLKRTLYLTALALLAGCSARPTTVARFDLTEGDRAIVEAGVRATLTDPQSAEFGLMVGTSASDGAMTVCGTVNAKSGSRGGYTGNQMFIGLLNEATRPAIFSLTAMDPQPQGQLPVSVRCKNIGIELE